jgi:hypothetical protein
MGIFFSQQNNQPKKDKIHIEPIQENNLQPVISSDVQNIIKSINQPILPPLEIQPVEPVINPVMNEKLKKEIHSNYLLRVVKQENNFENQNKDTNNKNKKKRRKKKKEENN